MQNGFLRVLTELEFPRLRTFNFCDGVEFWASDVALLACLKVRRRCVCVCRGGVRQCFGFATNPSRSRCNYESGPLESRQAGWCTCERRGETKTSGRRPRHMSGGPMARAEPFRAPVEAASKPRLARCTPAGASCRVRTAVASGVFSSVWRRVAQPGMPPRRQACRLLRPSARHAGLGGIPGQVGRHAAPPPGEPPRRPPPRHPGMRPRRPAAQHADLGDLPPRLPV
jgi:hypothetical protein